jgi:tetratricopeptide (TPR) repeat protein
MLLSRRAQYQAASERADVAEVIFKKNNDRHALLGVYRLRVHVAYYRFDFEEMARWARKGIEEAVSPEDDVLLSASYTNLGLALANLDRGEQAIEVCERGIEFNRRRGDEGRALNGQQLLGTIYLSMRRWSSAEAILKSVLADAARLKDIGLQTQCQTHLTTVYLRTGRLVEAQNSLDEATALAGRYPDPFSKGVRHYLGTLIAIQVQDRATAMKRGYEVIRAWSGVGDAAILPAVDLAAFTLASFGDTQSGAYLFAHANGFRNRHGHSVSPHFAMVHEEAAALIGETLPAEDLGMDQIITYAVAALNRPPVAV